jgi:D-psicose/D-tagatose/L-ribulose 3-epimerase
VQFGVHLFTFLQRIDASAGRLLPRLRELGFDGCEIPLLAEQLDGIDLEGLRRRLDELGLFRIAGTGIPEALSTVSEDAGVRRRGIDFLRRCVDAAATLGAELLTGALYGPFGIRSAAGGRTPEQRRRSVEALGEVCAHARERGVSLGLEPLNRYEHYFVNTAAEAVALVREVGAPNLKVHLDTYHMNIEEKSLHDAVLSARGLLAHVHASENDRGTPGSGHLDWDGLFRGLAETGYRGRMVVETFFETVPDIADFSRLWRQLAADPESFCREALAFLRAKARQHGLS